MHSTLEQIAAQLIGATPDRIAPAGGGGNSRVYQVTAGSRAYALKMYPSIEGDRRDRMGTEMRALALFEKHGISCVPKAYASQPGYALLEWIEGVPVTTPDKADIDAAAEFLSRIKRLNALEETRAFPPASEACFSGEDVLAQMRRRLPRLEAISDEPALAEFLAHTWHPAFAQAETNARQALADFSTPLAHTYRSLIPADFGFHNALRKANNGLIFIDFEYFGWDDPVKLAADFLLHPGTTLPQPLADHFRRGMTNLFANDPAFSARLAALLPLFALRWALILLNEFLPERWKARANTRPGTSWEEAKKAQLIKAHAMLTWN